MDSIRVTVRTSLVFKDIFGNWRFGLKLPKGSTFQDFIDELIKTWGDQLAPHLFQTDGQMLRPNIMCMINGHNIRFLDNLETELKQDDEILILPPVGGG
jgi:sulfur-carrier protein